MRRARGTLAHTVAPPMPPLASVTIGVLALLVPSCDPVPVSSDRSFVLGCDGQTYPLLGETPYVLPYPVGASYRMGLGNCSSSFHSPDLPDRYAYDFDMPIGALIMASRAGTVVHVVESGDDGRFPNNLVVVRHADGTSAQYMHLTRDGADVSVGDDVETGDPIGRSGNTGSAGTPHLHFIVTVGDWHYPYVPTPVSFSNASPRDLILRQGTTYTASSP